jgi:uncharacterized Zn-finger protein
MFVQVLNCMMCFTICKSIYYMMWLFAVRQYQCPQCQKNDQSEKLLEKHRAEHMNHHTCPFCGKAFPWPSSLSAHIRYYKPFKCDLCEYR